MAQPRSCRDDNGIRLVPSPSSLLSGVAVSGRVISRSAVEISPNRSEFAAALITLKCPAQVSHDRNDADCHVADVQNHQSRSVGRCAAPPNVATGRCGPEPRLPRCQVKNSIRLAPSGSSSNSTRPLSTRAWVNRGERARGRNRGECGPDARSWRAPWYDRGEGRRRRISASCLRHEIRSGTDRDAPVAVRRNRGHGCSPFPVPHLRHMPRAFRFPGSRHRSSFRRRRGFPVGRRLR
jgi:hypothetical protein